MLLSDTYQLSNGNQVIVRALHESIFKSWYHGNKSCKDGVLSPLPVDEKAVTNVGIKAEPYTYSTVNDSSGSPASSPIRKRPLVRSAWTLHKACTVRAKCRPWETRGSDKHLPKQMKCLISQRVGVPLTLSS